jgi:hypothetical protein
MGEISLQISQEMLTYLWLNLVLKEWKHLGMQFKVMQNRGSWEH